MAREGVVATGIGYKNGNKSEPCIVVSVDRKKPAYLVSQEDMVPTRLGKYRTDVVEIGKINAIMAPTGRFRPAPGGVSFGHPDITAGTLGIWMKRKSDGAIVALTNNHVAANSNNASIGDPVFQPGPADGGVLSDTLGYLDDFVEISFGTGGGGGGGTSFCDVLPDWLRSILCAIGICDCGGGGDEPDEPEQNFVDAAIVRPDDIADVNPMVLEIGYPETLVEAVPGMRVQKYGRTTEFQSGEVQQVAVQVQVQYGGGQIAIFDDQILTSNISAGGDSGSAVFGETNADLTGLLFAGSDTVTVINPIEYVVDLLDLELLSPSEIDEILGGDLPYQ